MAEVVPPEDTNMESPLLRVMPLLVAPEVTV
jgi:hypothetical protein